MVNFGDIITLPYKMATAGPRTVINLVSGKTDCADLIPCGKKNNSSSTDGGNETMSNPLGGIFGGGDGKKTNYLDYPWNKLPGNARSAASTLGYNEGNWTVAWAPAEDKWWEDLNSSEREAAETLGWDQHAWDDHYNEVYWNDLPQHVKDAASKLGFTSAMWDNDEWPSSCDKWWNGFSDDEKKALNTLGYSYYDWE